MKQWIRLVSLNLVLILLLTMLPLGVLAEELPLPDDTVQLTLKYEDGTTPDEIWTLDADGLLGELPVPVRVGYAFRGWNSEADGSGRWVYSNAMVSFLPETIYAVWEESEGTWFRFHADTGDAGVLTMVPSLTSAGDLLCFCQVNPLEDKENRFLTGFTVDGKAVRFTDPLQGNVTEGTENQVYAVWQTVTEPSIHYMGCSISGHCTDAVDQYVDQLGAGTVTLRGADTFTCSNASRALIGWMDLRTNTQYLPGQTVELTKSMTLHAVYGYAMIRADWNYAGAGADLLRTWSWAEGSLEQFGTPHRDGYLFLGWNTAPDGTGTMYAETAEISQLPQGGYSLYAQWEQLPEGDYYILKSSVPFENGAYATAHPAQNPLPDKVGNDTVYVWRNQQGENLWGYYAPETTPSLASGSVLELIPYIDSDDYAYLILDGNGGTGFLSDTTRQYVAVSLKRTASSTNLETYLSDYETFVSGGAAWVGWNTQKDGSGTAYAVDERVEDVITAGEVTTLYAQWAVRPSGADQLLYAANGGAAADGTVTAIQTLDATAESWTILANPFTRAGKSFLGWKVWLFAKTGGWIGILNGLYMPGQVLTISDLMNMPQMGYGLDQVTMMALWGYARVTYHADEEAKETVYQEAAKFPEHYVNEKDIIFRGWNTKEDGTGTWYVPGQTIPEGLSVDLYAITEEATADNCLLVTRAGVFADGSRVQDVELTDGSATIILPAVEGSLGWMVYPAMKENGNVTLTYGTTLETGILVPAGTEVTVHAGQVIYAVENTGFPWDESLRVYHGNGGVSVNEPAEEIRVQIVNASAGRLYLYDTGSFQRSGYTFTGWNTEADGSGTSYEPGQWVSFAGTLELYAQWRSNSAVVDPILPVKPIKPAKPQQTVRFRDVADSDWFAEAVEYVVTQNLMQGVGDQVFAPGDTVTRAMLVQILYNLEGQPKSGTGGFYDVPAGAWYYDAVTWAVENQITTGYSATEFGPEDPVTREQVAVFLFRYAVAKGMNAVTMAELLSGYADGKGVSAYAATAMNWAVAQGLVGGRDDGTLDPQGQATRAEAAAILMRYHKQIS